MNNKDFGTKLKELRLSRGWTPGQLALRAGVSRSAITSSEKRGDVSPRLDTLLGLAKAFNMSIDELFGKVGGKAEGTVKETKRPYEYVKDRLQEMSAEMRRLSRVVEDMEESGKTEKDK